MFPYLFSVGSEANVKQCVLFVLGRPAVYLLFISIIRNETCTFRISYNTWLRSNFTSDVKLINSNNCSKLIFRSMTKEKRLSFNCSF